MQTQTRIAIGLGVVVVVVAGYFFYNSSKPAPIELEEPTKDAERPQVTAASPPRDTKSAVQPKAEPPEWTWRATAAEAEEPAATSLQLPKQVAAEPEQDINMQGEASGMGPAEASIGPRPATGERQEPLPVTRSPAVQPEVPRPQMREHVVRAGDTFSSLAVEFYGSQRYTQYLIAANPQVSDPDVLRIGMKLKVPPRPDTDADWALRTGRTAEEAAKPLSADEYLVKPGDTFSSIAKARLGEERRWPELYEINKELFPRGPHTIKAGTVIHLSEPHGR